MLQLQDRPTMSARSVVARIECVLAGMLSIFRAFSLGFFHGVNAMTLFLYLRANGRLRGILWSCLMLNGVFFFSLWVAFFFFPSMWAFVGTLLWGDVGGPVGVEAVKVRSEVRVVGRVLCHVFDIMWVLPMYTITQVLGICWYNALYLEAYAEKKRRACAARVTGAEGNFHRVGEVTSASAFYGVAEPPSFYRAVVLISEVMFKVFVTAVYALLVVIVEAMVFAPVGCWLAFIMKSWLYAFYVFDYRLSSQYTFDCKSRRYARVTLSEALKLFEGQWAYFLGFGATQFFVMAALHSVWIPSSWFSVASVTSVLFAAHVVLSVEATPGPRPPFTLQLFTPFFAVCGILLRVISNALI